MQRVFGSTVFLFSSFALGVIGFIAACKDEGCEDKCLANCRKKCKLSYFAQLSPCSYACIVDNLYSYHTEPNFKQCGTDRNPKETCCFTCVSQGECYKTYKEYVSDGTKCLVSHSDEQGTCRAGICVTKRRTVSHPFTDYLKQTLNLPRLIAGSIIGVGYLTSVGVRSRENGKQTIDEIKEATSLANTSLTGGIDTEDSLGADSNSAIGMETNSGHDGMDTDDTTVERSETTITEAGVGIEEKAKDQAEQVGIGTGVATGGNVKNIAELNKGTAETNDEVDVDVNTGVNGDTLVETDLEIAADVDGSPAQEVDTETRDAERRKTTSGINQDEHYSHKTKTETDAEDQEVSMSRINSRFLTSDVKEEARESEILEETSIEKSIDGSIYGEISESTDEADSDATRGEDSEGILKSVIGNVFSEDSKLESASIEETDSDATEEEDSGEESKSVSGSVEEEQEDTTSRMSAGILTIDSKEEAIESEILKETSIEESIEGLSDEIPKAISESIEEADFGATEGEDSGEELKSISESIEEADSGAIEGENSGEELKSISESIEEADSGATEGEDSGEELKSISKSVDEGISSDVSKSISASIDRNSSSATGKEISEGISKSKSGSTNGTTSDATVKKISEEISDLVSVLIDDGHSREISKSVSESNDDAASNHAESEILEGNSTSEKSLNTFLDKESVTFSGVTVRHALGRIEILDSEGNILEVIKTFTVSAPRTNSERGSSEATRSHAGDGYETNSTITENRKMDEINRSVAGRGIDREHEKVVVVRVSGVGEESKTATNNEDDVDIVGDDESGRVVGSGSDKGREIYSEKR
ncbi:uncharacterized protein TNIN_88201 [Trichonephila inaurata madagascariensis]|uniref:Uncharacterized protein n=1 Tax=Trichonephila inaurata madagascariensis TaxID=2747483 RepID=A0A8X6XKW3_9ARAC|nr:uncharacterized protein TNIN_88201 [Trichonephila inaurata madagascariensis]